MTGFSDNLRQHGYAVCPAEAMAQHQVAFMNLAPCYDKLPRDPYCKNGNRFRSHSRYLIAPWAGQLIARPHCPYRQASSFNPADGDIARQFAPLELDEGGSLLLRHLIQWDLSQLSLAQADQGIDVGVHMVRMTCTPDVLGVASPPCLHKDGEFSTFLHICRRHDITGGESVIADNDKQVLFEAVLEPMATLAVLDYAVYHHVMPIRPAPGATKGYRDVLLIDFTPLVPDIR